MMSLLGIVAGVAAVLAVIVTSLFIGVCLAVARVSDAVRGRRQAGARAALPSSVAGNGSGVHAASRRGEV